MLLLSNFWCADVRLSVVVEVEGKYCRVASAQKDFAIICPRIFTRRQTRVGDDVERRKW